MQRGVFGGAEEALALDGIEDGALEAAGVAVAFDEVVLRARLHGAEAEGFVFDAGEHDDGDVGRVGDGGAERVEAAGVGQGEVEEDDVGHADGERLGELAEVAHMYDRKPPPPRPAEESAHDDGILRVVLDEDDQGEIVHSKVSIGAGPTARPAGDVTGPSNGESDRGCQGTQAAGGRAAGQAAVPSSARVGPVGGAGSPLPR
ncbi:MAG: hypothetical protein R3F65_18595 [bacterium]